MFGSIINRFQTFSPVTSPVTSPKMSRRKQKTSAHRRSLKDEYRDVQSEPEDACGGTSSSPGYRRGYASSLLHDDGGPSSSSSSGKKSRGRKQLLLKSKSTARLDISAPTAAAVVPSMNGGGNYHRGSKSMGRLEGLREVHIVIIYYY